MKIARIKSKKQFTLPAIIRNKADGKMMLEFITGHGPLVVTVPIPPKLREDIVLAAEYPHVADTNYIPPLQTDPNTPPKVGYMIWIPSHMCREGGLALVTRVTRGKELWVEVQGRHGRFYSWDVLCAQQEELKNQFGTTRAKQE